MKILEYGTLEEIEKAISENSFDYCLKYELSKVELGRVDENYKLDFSELMEARLFDNKKELRIFKYNGKWRGACVEKEDGDFVKEYERNIASNIMSGAKYVARQYREFDDDGQIVVKATSLCGIEVLKNGN